jgi:DNA-directed RNA polymerase specialized sigma24 family protein
VAPPHQDCPAVHHLHTETEHRTNTDQHDQRKNHQPTKGTTANTNINLTPEQSRFVEQTYRALQRICKRRFAKANRLGLKPDDIANFAIKIVIANLDKHMRRSPIHCANAVATNAFNDLVRRELSQRGHGARGTRTVIGDEPINREDSGAGSVIENYGGGLDDPDSWVERNHRETVLGEVSELISRLAFDGFVLTTINGLSQGEAAEVLGVSRTHLNKEMKKATRLLQGLGVSYDQWGVN